MSSVLYGRKSSAQMHFYNSNIGAAVKMLKYQNIAPAPATAGGKVRKYTPRTANVPYSVDQTQSVQRRNARERNRVKQVNNSFARLRQHIPQTIIMDLTKGGGRGPHKKISKVDTLRIAVEYIRRLQDLVDDLNGGHSSSSNSNSANSSSRCIIDTTSNSSFGSSTLADSPSPGPSANTSASTNASASSPQSEQLFYANAFQQHLQQQQQQQPFSSSLLTAEALQVYAPPAQTHTQLEAACHSPTSSFNSSMSFDSGTFEQPQPPSNNASLNANLQLKFEPYDSFNLHEEDCTPDDEEILDYISLWQEQ